VEDPPVKSKIRIGAACIAAFLVAAFSGCGESDPPRDLDAYVCGDAEKAEEDRETDPNVIASADCIEVYDETNADDGEVGEFVGRYVPEAVG
jgi:hypothetical protein